MREEGRQGTAWHQVRQGAGGWLAQARAGGSRVGSLTLTAPQKGGCCCRAGRCRCPRRSRRQRSRRVFLCGRVVGDPAQEGLGRVLPGSEEGRRGSERFVGKSDPAHNARDLWRGTRGSKEAGPDASPARSDARSRLAVRVWTRDAYDASGSAHVKSPCHHVTMSPCRHVAISLVSLAARLGQARSQSVRGGRACPTLQAAEKAAEN
jgi:hypothetical protein